MDIAKCQALKQELCDQPEPQLVPIARFFDGNDDLGSIGCNLDRHPGINVFHDILVGLLDRPDVEAVYAQIAELDPGEDSWPFTDTILVVGAISAHDLSAVVSRLEPDEVTGAKDSGVSTPIGVPPESPTLVLWWD